MIASNGFASAPANIGLFQLFTAMALQLLEAEPSDAKVFSVILFFAHTFPQILVGVGEARVSAGNRIEVGRSSYSRKDSPITQKDLVVHRVASQ